MIGANITIRNQRREVVLQLTILPPDGFRIDRLNMRYRDLVLRLDNTFGVTAPSVNGALRTWQLPAFETKGATSAIDYVSDPSLWHGDKLEVIGDIGVRIPHSGITLAHKAGIMLPKRITGSF